MTESAATPADVLDAAATHIEQFGWMQDFFCDEGGDPTKAPVCVRGAISVAAGQHPEFTDDPEYYACRGLGFDEDDQSNQLDEADGAALRLVRDSENALGRHLNAKYGVPIEAYRDPAGHRVVLYSYEAPSWWQDQEGITAQMVIDELRAAARDLREKAGR